MTNDPNAKAAAAYERGVSEAQHIKDAEAHYAVEQRLRDALDEELALSSSQLSVLRQAVATIRTLRLQSALDTMRKLNGELLTAINDVAALRDYAEDF